MLREIGLVPAGRLTVALRTDGGIDFRAMTKDVQIAFEAFLEKLSECVDEADFRDAMAGVAARLDVITFAYLSLPPQHSGKPKLISNYPARWTAHYLQNRYQKVDPVIIRARCGGCPFRWGSDIRGFATSQVQQRLFEEAAEFSIRCGLTIPIVDRRGCNAAVTFAADEPSPAFLGSRTGMNKLFSLLRPAFTFTFAEGCPAIEQSTVSR